MAVSLRPGEEAAVAVEITGVAGPFSVTAEVRLHEGEKASASLSLDGADTTSVLFRQAGVRLEAAKPDGGRAVLRLTSGAASGEAAVQWRNVRVVTGGTSFRVLLTPAPPAARIVCRAHTICRP
jgi:hypothetical protein